MNAICTHIGTTKNGKLHLAVNPPKRKKIFSFLFDPANNNISECDATGVVLEGWKFEDISANHFIVKRNKKSPVSAPDMIYAMNGRTLTDFKREYCLFGRT
jgi:hypothetical protein